MGKYYDLNCLVRVVRSLTGLVCYFDVFFCFIYFLNQFHFIHAYISLQKVQPSLTSVTSSSSTTYLAVPCGIRKI